MPDTIPDWEARYEVLDSEYHALAQRYEEMLHRYSQLMIEHAQLNKAYRALWRRGEVSHG